MSQQGKGRAPSGTPHRCRPHPRRAPPPGACLAAHAPRPPGRARPARTTRLRLSRCRAQTRTASRCLARRPPRACSWPLAVRAPRTPAQAKSVLCVSGNEPPKQVQVSRRTRHSAGTQPRFTNTGRLPSPGISGSTCAAPRESGGATGKGRAQRCRSEASTPGGTPFGRCRRWCAREGPPARKRGGITGSGRVRARRVLAWKCQWARTKAASLCRSSPRPATRRQGATPWSWVSACSDSGCAASCSCLSASWPSFHSRRCSCHTPRPPARAHGASSSSEPSRNVPGAALVAREEAKDVLAHTERATQEAQPHCTHVDACPPASLEKPRASEAARRARERAWHSIPRITDASIGRNATHRHPDCSLHTGDTGAV